MIELGLLPAAGEGVRAYPASSWTPKVLLEIAGKPILLRNLEILRDQMGVRDVVIILGHLGSQIRDLLGDGHDHGVHIRYVICKDPSIGLARGMLLSEPYLQRPFVTILADEVYLGSNHHELTLPTHEFDCVCGVIRTEDPNQIRKNYSVQIEGERILAVEEKPERHLPGLLGCGTYLFSPRIFDWIRRTPANARTGRVELTDAIGMCIGSGPPVLPFLLEGDYFNVNTVEDYNHANYVARSLEFDERRISIIIPAYNEEASIGFVVRDFRDHVNEVLVIDNSSADGTAEVARKEGARVMTVSLVGYGDTIKYGLDHARGDILVITEADHSFRSSDLGKFLEYLKDADMVIGTRTTRQMIEQGSNMGSLLRWGNVAVGKVLELLWWGQEPRFTDVGCSYRALWRDVWQRIRERVTSTGPEFSPEMMIEMLRARRRVIEIPISYHPRVGGASKHSQSPFAVARTAFRMLKLIVSKRLQRG